MFGFRIERIKDKKEEKRQKLNGKDVEYSQSTLYDTMDAINEEKTSKEDKKREQSKTIKKAKSFTLEFLKIASIFVLVLGAFMFRHYYMDKIIDTYFYVEETVTGHVDEQLLEVDKRQGIIKKDYKAYASSKSVSDEKDAKNEKDFEKLNAMSENSEKKEPKMLKSRDGFATPNIKIRGSVTKTDGKYIIFKFDNKIHTLKEGDSFDNMNYVILTVMKNGMEIRDFEGNEFRFYQEE